MRDINGEKNISLLMIFFTVSFSRFTPLSKFEKCLGKRLEVPDILLPDIRGLLILDKAVT